MSGAPGPWVSVRAATTADVDRVLALMRELAVYERLEHELVNTPERLAAQLFDRDAWPRVECLVAETDDSIAGYALFFGTYSSFRGNPRIWLEDLCVTEAARGRGVGEALMCALARIAVERGCTKLAWDVLDWNEPARGFYERLGATRGGEWHTYALAGDALAELGRG